MGSFGSPLTGNTNNRKTKKQQAKDRITHRTSGSVPPSVFLRYERHPMIRGGEGGTTVHNTGQRHNTGHRRRGNDTQGALQRPRERQGREKKLLGETLGPLTTPISRVKTARTHSREETKKDSTSKFEL